LPRPPTGRPGDGVDEFALGHVRTFFDPDGGRELDELGFLVGIESAVDRLTIELVRRVRRRCRCPFAQVFDRLHARLGIARSLLGLVLELLGLAVRFLRG
jgi:hypothetical protein